MQNLHREMVMENYETVMEKSWKKKSVGTLIKCDKKIRNLQQHSMGLERKL